MHCGKHGEYAENYYVEMGPPYPECPRCQYVREHNLCQECEQHTGTETFAEGSIAYVHGMYSKICRCCLLKHWRDTEENVKKGIEKLSAELTLASCS